MRLLTCTRAGRPPNTYTFSLIKGDPQKLPPYAILSHRWGDEEDEVTFRDIEQGTAAKRVGGYMKLEFCADQVIRDGLNYFWVDTCCIDKSSSAELQEAINSMYKWYEKSAKCYVYLSDVSAETAQAWEVAFQKSAWFTRGWTLQELIAPRTVEFFSTEGTKLGDKKSLEQQISQITGVSVDALRGKPLSQITEQERFSWTVRRQTTVDEDAVYCLLGIFDVHMPLIYGEGRQKALARLVRETRMSANADPYNLFDWWTMKPLGHSSNTMHFARDIGSNSSKPLLLANLKPTSNGGELSLRNLLQHYESAASPYTYLSQCPSTVSVPFSAIFSRENDGQTVAYQTVTFRAPYHEHSLEELRLADSAHQLYTTDFSLAGCPGTGITPFLPSTEKDTSGEILAYQTITFQHPYQGYSLEELRLADSRPRFSTS